ncbi:MULTISPECIES: iron-sulfur cluster assembly scaffold protein [Meridianimarinicoccus]|uniref:iron-sulfur cluster assembly scaffold protein n=1 Tax=Meridianimarinicoccus zhengii TaxID=2056810 RepID=UPI000DABB487|nr:iron-sulfur cluster assembly scaffold protein [Phycocomes zhengii]
MSDTALINLYSRQILALAADIPHIGRLDAPLGTARVRAPLCGSVVTVDVDLDGDRITRFAQDVKACALGQAAAAVVGANAIGATRADIAAARDALAAMLKSNGPAPAAPFDGLAVMQAAQDFGNRHASILLSLDATLAAIDAATAQDQGTAST